MTLLARREYGTAELRQRLRSYDFGPDVVEGLLNDLTREGILSDDRFVESFVRARVDRGYGPVRIRYELRERDIDEALTEKWLGCYASEWFERLAAVREKQFGEPPPTGHKDRARQARYLQHRGFTPEQVWALLDDRPAD